MYPGRDLNPHDHYWPQDFKSCVSTSSTTRAIDIMLNKKWSGRRDSNPRPRPWQGRALPTELLPQMLIFGLFQKRRKDKHYTITFASFLELNFLLFHQTQN